jgi:hypothetical protein
MSAVAELPLLRLQMTFEAQGAGRFPAFAGSVWRGGFGHALKRLVCVMRLRPCAGCPLERSCIYPTLFEAAPEAEGARLSLIERVAQPYALMPPPRGPAWLEPGQPAELAVTLVGRAIAQRAYVVRALEEAAAGGLGPDRLALARREVVAVDAAELAAPPAAGPVAIRLLTPLRCKRDGRLVTPERLRPGDLLMALVRRVSMLASFHGGGPLELDFADLKARAAGLAWRRADLAWRETVRRSARQQAILRMGGVVGEAELDAAALGPLAPFLRLAPWLGAGKGASMGLGQIALGAGRAA